VSIKRIAQDHLVIDGSLKEHPSIAAHFPRRRFGQVLLAQHPVAKVLGVASRETLNQLVSLEACQQ